MPDTAACPGTDLVLLGMLARHHAGCEWLTPAQISKASGRAADVVHDLPILLDRDLVTRSPSGGYRLTPAGFAAAAALTGEWQECQFGTRPSTCYHVPRCTPRLPGQPYGTTPFGRYVTRTP